MENEWVCGEGIDQIASRMQSDGSNDEWQGLDLNEVKGEFKRRMNKIMVKHVHGTECVQWSKERKNQVKQHLSTLKNLHMICNLTQKSLHLDTKQLHFANFTAPFKIQLQMS